MISGAYEIKTARNNNVRNIFNAKYNQITVECNYLVCPGNGSLQRRYIIRGSKIPQKMSGGCPKNFPPTCTLCASHATWSPATSSLPLCQNVGSASGPYQSKTAATSGCALHIILCTDACRHMSQTHTYTHTQRHRCMLGWMHT